MLPAVVKQGGVAVGERPASCRNCGAPLGGEYCARCGQREGLGDLHFAEAVGDIVGATVGACVVGDGVGGAGDGSRVG